jgi:hypothetical protein
MRKTFSLLTFVFLIVAACGLQTVSAQFPKLPKIPKPSQPKPQPTPTETTEPTPSSETAQPQPESRNTTQQGPSSGGPYAKKPEPPDTPMLLAETLEIRTETWDYYWKAPGQSSYTSWVPRVRFEVKYAGSIRLRFKADYFMPDGQLWFNETLEQKGGGYGESTSTIESQYGTEDDKKTIVTAGTFGVKITNMRDNSVVFQGKFKVIKFKPDTTDPRYKTHVDFFVDQDWNLPIGYANYKDESLGSAYPSIRMWFKGGLNSNDLEARLYYNGKELATTDEGGNIGSAERRFPKHAANDPALHWEMYEFYWPGKILFITDDEARRMTANQGKLYINQMPGEYTVKVFYKGEQVRETKFTIADGNFVDNGLARQNKISTDKLVLPVKVMGTADKWNVAAKTDGFYGNPLTGFNQP